MPRTSKVIQSLNAGELSPMLDCRIDQDKYQMGCRTMENFYPLIYGGAERRPGTYYTGPVKDFNVKCYAVDFVYSVEQSYILEFGHKYIRFFANSGRFVGVLAADTAVWATASKYYAGDFAKGNTDGYIYRCLITHVSDSGGTDGTGGTCDSDANPTQWENTSVVKNWADATGYDISDYVTYSGSIYVCLSAHTSATGGGDGAGGEPDTNPTQWQEYVFNANPLQTDDLYPIYEIPSPYESTDLFELKFEQSADVMFITHPAYESRKLSRISYTTFVLEETDYDDGPFQDLNTVLTAKISASARTGTITLTASGTNEDGSEFQPFVSGSTAGHSPSTVGSTDENVGTSQKYKSLTGALFKLVHSNDDNAITTHMGSVRISDSIFVAKGVSWDFVTQGIWTGTILLQRSYDQVVWETLLTVVSEDNNNVQTSGTEEIDDAYYRVNMTEYDTEGGGSATVILQLKDSERIGVVEIQTVASATSATGIVRSKLGSKEATHRWAEGYWSNYRGWPNSVAISSEERLTFAGSPSFPLTIWGSVSGEYDSMKIGIYDDDAIIFTLVGNGKQNEILWISSKNSLVLGTHGGEHLLGASSDDEALTPSNVRAKIQSTYGSENIQSLMVGDSILFVQRGGRKLREMHYDVVKDSQVCEDLTVFSNHISESGITQMAYQRIPEPMVWCVRSDGQLAVLSYERSQDVWSWCRIMTSTNSGESDIESVAVIPVAGAEEDQVYIIAKRTIAGVNGGNPVRYVEYFSTREF